MSDAIWLPHPLYTAYEVSNDGRIRSIDRLVKVHGSEYHAGSVWYEPRKGRELKQHLAKNGYMTSVVSVASKRINVRVHRMVCETFHGLPTEVRPDVRHLNGVKTDNRAENLCWGTKSENMVDKQRHGTDRQKSKTHCPRGHALAGDNVYRRQDRPSHRECFRCKRGRDAARSSRRENQ
ncbi:NUMOD4 motif-containing HNH endonuclease [Mycobacterium sp. NPDC049093]